MKIFQFLTLFLVLLSYSAFGQTKTVKGNVSDENNQALPGVSIIIKGSQIGTTTDIEGNYTLEYDNNPEIILVFSYVGYQSQEILLAGRTELSISMKPDEIMKDEIVVIG